MVKLLVSMFPTAHPADLGCRGGVAFDQSRRNAQSVRDIVESFARIVGGQQRGRVDIEREQIADGVRILSAVQAMQPGEAGIGIGSCGAIECRFELVGESVHGGAVRTRRASRRHHARADFPHDFLPSLRVWSGMREIQLVQHQTGRFESSRYGK